MKNMKQTVTENRSLTRLIGSGGVENFTFTKETKNLKKQRMKYKTKIFIH